MNRFGHPDSRSCDHQLELPTPGEKQTPDDQSDTDDFREKSFFWTHIVRVDTVTDDANESESAESRVHELVEPGEKKIRPVTSDCNDIYKKYK